MTQKFTKGTILMPNEYMRRNSSFISGMIINIFGTGERSLYEIQLTNGNIVTKDYKSIIDLFDPYEDDTAS